MKLIELYWEWKEVMKDGSVSLEERKTLAIHFDEFMESITGWEKKKEKGK